MQNQNPSYAQLHRDQSTWPLEYVLTQTQPIDAFRPALGLNAPGVGSDQIAVSNVLDIPPTSRTQRIKSQLELWTELYGTAPYLGGGDGIIYDVETSNALRDSIYMLRGQRSRHWMADQPYDTWSFIDVPNASQDVVTQVGYPSRSDLAYE